MYQICQSRLNIFQIIFILPKTKSFAKVAKFRQSHCSKEKKNICFFSILATPTLANDEQAVFVTTLNGQCRLIDVATGDSIVEVDLQAPVFSSPAFIGSKIFVITGK